MIKKVLIALTAALVLTVGVLGVVGTIYAQDVAAEAEIVEVESVPEQATFEYEYSYQYGEQNGNDPIMTQTQTRLREHQVEGECTGDGEQLQVRQQIGAGNQGEMKQQRLNLGDGTCDGTCTPQRVQGGRGQ